MDGRMRTPRTLPRVPVTLLSFRTGAESGQ
jgi:hypothetical protein